MANPQRPLSPHLQVYRWQVQMVTSILHRATGIALAFGALAIAWGLLALAGGRGSWESFSHCAGSPLGLVLLFGWAWAFSFHLINGICHLVQDAGYDFAIPQFVRNSWISIVGSLVLVAAIFLCAFKMGGAA